MLKRHIQISGIVLLLLAVMVSGASGGKPEIEAVVSRLQNNYKEMKDYRADFVQEAKIKGYPRAQRSSGEVFYRKPGMMRWNYDEPEKQEIVTDGKTLWMYTPSLEQVMKADFSMTSQSKVAGAFLSGMGNISKDFNISIKDAGHEGDNIVLELIPKDKNDPVKSLELSVDRKSAQVKKSVMTDIYGNVTIVSLSNFKVNTGLEEKLFDFVPPKGVEVIAPPAM